MVTHGLVSHDDGDMYHYTTGCNRVKLVLQGRANAETVSRRLGSNAVTCKSCLRSQFKGVYLGGGYIA